MRLVSSLTRHLELIHFDSGQVQHKPCYDVREQASLVRAARPLIPSCTPSYLDGPFRRAIGAYGSAPAEGEDRLWIEYRQANLGIKGMALAGRRAHPHYQLM